MICAGGGAAAISAVYTTATLDNFVTRTDAGTIDSTIGVGSFDWVKDSGEYTPATFGGGTTNSVDSWAAVTLALRPMISNLSVSPSSSTSPSSSESPSSSTSPSASISPSVSPSQSPSLSISPSTSPSASVSPSSPVTTIKIDYWKFISVRNMWDDRTDISTVFTDRTKTTTTFTNRTKPSSLWTNRDRTTNF
jgi:hypothetical protein